MENTVIDFSQYSDEELDLIIQGLGSIDLDFRDELATAMVSVKGNLNERMQKEEIDAMVNKEVREAKQRLEDKSERIVILKAKLIAFRRARQKELALAPRPSEKSARAAVSEM